MFEKPVTEIQIFIYCAWLVAMGCWQSSMVATIQMIKGKLVWRKTAFIWNFYFTGFKFLYLRKEGNTSWTSFSQSGWHAYVNDTRRLLDLQKLDRCRSVREKNRSYEEKHLMSAHLWSHDCGWSLDCMLVH